MKYLKEKHAENNNDSYNNPAVEGRHYQYSWKRRSMKEISSMKQQNTLTAAMKTVW